MNALMISRVCALVAPAGPPARRGSSHCHRRSLRLIAVANCCSSGIFGSSSHGCGTSPVQTVPGGTWLAAVRSCTGHSGNWLSSRSSRFEVSAFWPHSGSACHAIFSCRLPCLPGTAGLPFICPLEPYELLWLSFERGPEYPLYFCVIWPFGMHGVTLRHRQEWGCLGLWLRLWFGRWRHWGRFRLRFGSFGLAGRDARPLGTTPWLGPGFFWRQFWGLASARCGFGGCQRCCMSVVVPHGSVHTSKFVRVFLQASGAMFESFFRVRGPGHPAFRS